MYANSDRDDIKKTLMFALNRAKKTITLQIYSLTDPEIIKVLGKKSREGLDVAVYYDPKATASLPLSIPSYPIHASGLMHRKILTIDNTLTFLGTANFTEPSLKLHDNLLLGVHHPALAKSLRESIEGFQTYHIKESILSCYLLPEKADVALQALCQKIDQAQETVRIAMFTLTHPILLEHLLKAHERGVKIELAIDRYAHSGSSKKAISLLKNAGITILVHRKNTLFHHKWAWIDQKILCLGSANWTRAAFGKNQDFLLIFENPGNQESKKLKALWQTIANSTIKD